MRIYVGTYAKYNNGNLFGKGEFIKECKTFPRQEIPEEHQ